MQKEISLKSTIICPSCGFAKEETMPEDSCQFFYECGNCHVILKHRKGDCCVFCSYGNVPCPPIQVNENCCGVKLKINKVKVKITPNCFPNARLVLGSYYLSGH